MPQRDPRFRTRIGTLYGAKVGAVIGVGAAGFYLLPTFGLSTTTWIAASANLALCIGALTLSNTVEALPQDASDTEDKDRWQLSALGLVALLAGLSSLLHEVAWFRLMALVLGASAYAFSVMLFSFLLGIGSGGWVGGRLADRLYNKNGTRQVLLGLATIEVGIAVLTWFAMYGYADTLVIRRCVRRHGGIRLAFVDG